MLLPMESVVARPSSALRLKPPLPVRHLCGLGFGAGPLIVRGRWRSLDLSVAVARNGALSTNSAPQSNGVYTVGDFMTKKEDLCVVKPSTSVDEGSGRVETSMFPEVDSTWKTFNEVQKLLGKTNGKVIGDVMTSAPLVVRETTNLEDAARILLATKYRRLPVVDSAGRLVGIITRGNVVRAALQIKHANERNSQV
ncbi:CBS domain-containing protein CBSX1, chloroplastic isoform X3 [Musa acuminata AAA Group]|uniref:CBS domain-containing protein CBSX1, chloroplastic isoform X3 n=1 Tax=Musa acuminata AAA Group TaxID=214697 RepID=UPI0031D83623